MKAFVNRRGWSIVAYVLGAGLWELTGRLNVSSFIPPLSTIVASIPAFYASAQFRTDLGISFASLGIGFGLAIVIGIPLGLLIAMNKVAYWFVSPYLTFFLTAPKPALAPVLIVVFGLGPEPVVIVVFLYSFFFIILNTYSAMRAVPDELAEMARSHGCGRFTVLWKIGLPHATPLILSGTRLGGGLSVKGLVLGQQLVASAGIGALIDTLTFQFQIVHFYALMIGVTVLGLVIMALIGMLERRVAWERLQPSTASIGG